MASRYDRVLAKYEWAKEHVDKFDVASLGFKNGTPKPYAIQRDFDDTTGEIVYRMTVVSDVPEALCFMLGDAIHNLRSALDHAAYAVVEAGTSKPDRYTYFPVFDTPDAYKAGLKGRIPGQRKACYEVLDRVQPYQGGFGNWVWQLHRLDIIDKHRLLLAVTSIPVGHTGAPSEIGFVGASKRVIGDRKTMLHEMAFGHAPGTEVFRAVQAGDEIGRFPATKDYENVGFAFDIAIHEAEVIRGWPTYLLLRVFCTRIMDVINDLAPFM